MKLADAKRTPVAWPGGYPIYATMKDGEQLCFECLTDESNPIDETGEASGNDPCWTFVDATIYWEGETLECAHCGQLVIESAYGPVPEQHTQECGPT